MNVLIISSPNPYRTAGIVALNLLRGLRAKGHDAKLLVQAYGKYHDKNIINIQSVGGMLMNKMLNRMSKISGSFIKKTDLKINHDYHIQDYDQTITQYTTKKILRKAKFKPDAILYVFPQNFLTAKNLYELNKSTGAPIYWYLMDSAALTGCCHYAWDCDKYITGCECCPGLFSNNINDQSAINFKFKLEYLNKTNLRIIAATEWQYRQAVKSLLFKNKPVEKVLLSVDHEVFKYVPKSTAKLKLNVPQNKKIIFFGSSFLDEKRKGISYLLKALDVLCKSNASHDIFLLIAGNNFDYVKNDLPYQYLNLGLLDNNEQLASVFQAADVFVCPSIEDSGPMMINQSVMCGTPVVSFEMGVALDIVIPGSTGYRAKLKDINDLARGIDHVLKQNEEEYQKMVDNCISLAQREYTVAIQIEKIVKLIESA